MSLDLLLFPFQIDFMQHAFLMALLVSLPCSLLSCYLILKGWSLIGDAMAHAVLPGIIIAYLLNFALSLGAFMAALFCAVLNGFLKKRCDLKEDTLMGVVFSAMFAFGLVLYTKIESDIHLDHILFGNLLGIHPYDLLQVGVIAFGVSLFIALQYKDLFLSVFDPLQAHIHGISSSWFTMLLLICVAVSIVAAFQAVGMILSIALLIAPGAIAFLVTKRFPIMLCVALIVGVSTSFTGVYLSFFMDSAPAPTIILVQMFIFTLCLFFKMRYFLRQYMAQIYSRSNM